MTDVTEKGIYNNRYEIIRQIARGGMAEVYLARDLQLHRSVALKVLFRELSVDQTFIRRFRHEAQAAANLTHPNIVSIFDWGESEADNTYFIVMELVDGEPLSKMIRTRGTIEPVRAAEIGRDIASGLAYAHSRGVIHRDVKPGNAILTHEGTAKVTDFGIARAHNSDESLTQTGAVMGTATYFSPEQAQGESVDARSDIYSLAVVLYEMVSGRPPFTGDNAVAIATKHVREFPTPLTELDPTVPGDFEAIVMKAMSKSPDDRYQSAGEMRDDLARFCDGKTVSAPEYDPSLTAFFEPGAAATTVVASPGARTRSANGAGSGNGANPEQVAPQTSVPKVVAWIAGLVAILTILGFGSYYAVQHIGASSASTTFDVPNVVNQTLTKAEATLHSHELKWTITYVSSANASLTVVNQQPPYPTPVTRGTTVILQVSKGGKLNVPSEVGIPIQQAQNALTNAGFKVNISKKSIPCTQVGQYSVPPAIDNVITQSPSSGNAPAGSTIDLGVSQGVAVPSIVNLSSSAAANLLGQCQLNVGTTTNSPSPSGTVVPSGDVISTDPPANTYVNPNSTVNLTVSSGPGTTVPSVVNEKLSQAESDIANAQLTYTVQYQQVTSSSQVGMVLSQNPSSGTLVNVNSMVTLTVGQQSQATTTTSSPSSTSTTLAPTGPVIGPGPG
ncbi:MAG TPA: Stk1 family PASTA domain-containing Ser/Thr kinase [Acidimicrobiales bacterium]|nr:Stk1 family PASTA domain-containing Ser/Thr kinase [Acidimicrobiales bacterium]